MQTTSYPSPQNRTTLTVQSLCTESEYEALRAYLRFLDPKSQGFLYHMSLEQERPMSPRQADWFIELKERAVIQQLIDRGECVMPPYHDRGVAPAQPRALPVDSLEELFRP